MILSRTSRLNKGSHGSWLLSGIIAGALAGVGSVAVAEPPRLHPELISDEQWQQLNLEGIRTVREFSGVVWIGGDGGLAAFEKGQWRQWGLADGLPARRVVAMDMDLSTRDLWIGTLGGGLVRWTAGRFDVFNQFNSGLAGDLVFGVAVIRSKVYAATNGGVSEFEPSLQAWDLLVPRTANESQQVATKLWTDGGHLFADMWPEGVFRWDPSARNWAPDRAARLAELVASDRSHRAVGLTHTTIGQPAIAILGPGTRRMVLPGSRETPKDWLRQHQPDIAAVQLAVRTKHNSSTYSDVLLWQPAPGYAGYGWGLLEDDLVGYADNAELVGLVAHVDARQQYTAASLDFMRIPSVNVAAEPLNLGLRAARRPWIFSCQKDKPMRHRALLEYVRQFGRAKWIVVECDRQEGTVLRTEWTRSYARRMGLGDVMYIDSATSANDTAAVIDAHDHPAVFLWGDSAQAQRVVKSLNKPERDLLFAGGPELSGLKILELAAENRWTIVALDSDQPMVPCAEELLNGLGAANIAPSASSTPDDLACRTFDAADHLLSAVRSGPPGRAGVAESLLHMEEDIFGERHFETRRQNMAVRLVVLQDGRLRNEEITTSPITAGSTP